MNPVLDSHSLTLYLKLLGWGSQGKPWLDRKYTSFRWKNTRFLRTMNESYIFQWVLCHIGFSYPLFLQTWCSVMCTGCICQESAIQLSSWQSFPKYRREGKYRREKIDKSNKAQNLYFGDQDNGFRVLNEIDIVYQKKSYVLIISDEPMPRFRPFASYLMRKV